MTSGNLLVTGAAGYIGGSIVADFLAGVVPSLKNKIVAAVRSEEQATALSDTGVKVVRLDLTDRTAVIRCIADHGISIVIHAANSIDPDMVLSLITGLGKQRKDTGQQTYFIHTSAMSAFLPKTGWPSDKSHATGSDVFETERQLADSHPVRKTDVTVIEHAQVEGVTSFIVIPCLTHGKGTGAWNKLSVNMPIVINASIKRKEVGQFADNVEVPHVHISDLTALYGQIVENILRGEKSPSGADGYYFSVVYQIHSYEFADKLAAALHARGLVAKANPGFWTSTEAAAEALGVPAVFVEYLWNAGNGTIILNNGAKIGWNPKWDKQKFLDNLDDEIDSVLELGKAKSSLIDSLFAAARQ